MRVREALREAAERLRAGSIESYRLDAELLASRALGIRRIELLVDSDRAATSDELEALRAMTARREAGEPMAYILGEREFHGLRFRVDPRVLIPRPETEHLVEAVADRLAASAHRSPPRGIDLGTGSGAIAIALLYRCPGLRMVAVDRSVAALRVASANGVRLGVRHRLDIVASDWLEAFVLRNARAHAPFDLVVSNPPYLLASEMPSLPKDVRAFEPELALCSGDDAFAAHRVIAQAARHRLAPDGWLALELSGSVALPDLQTLDWLEGYTDRQAIEDYAGVARVLLARRAAERRGDTSTRDSAGRV